MLDYEKLLHEINLFKYLYLCDLTEGIDKTVIIKVCGSKVLLPPIEAEVKKQFPNPTKTDREIMGLLMASSPVIPDEAIIYELSFRYAAYHMLSESFGTANQNDCYKLKGVISILSSSEYLDFIRANTLIPDLLPAMRNIDRYDHYRIICCDHVIDVIAQEPPKIYCRPLRNRSV